MTHVAHSVLLRPLVWRVGAKRTAVAGPAPPATRRVTAHQALPIWESQPKPTISRLVLTKQRTPVQDPEMLLALIAQLAVATPDARANSGNDVPLRSVPATQATSAPSIDGHNDDGIWRTAPRISGFRQFQPNIDVDPSMNTEFQVAYDARNLYVFVRMFDPRPDSIMHALSRRDVRGPSDQVKLIIDSYDDKRTGFELAVNPDGVKRDYAITNDADEDESWNGIWDVATRVDSAGWTAEFRVPLSQLRYSGGASHTFGFGIWRDIERRNERVGWPLYSPTRNGLVSQLGEITGLNGITSARRIELAPYIVTRDLQRVRPNDTFRRAGEVSVGADIKVGITPNITLDATVNPDFGQVEADPSVLNLTAFEVFVQERRPFFVAGTGLYQFRLNCYIVVDCSTNEGLFYSRRIGRSPSLRDASGDASTPTSTPIAVATKLTGRTGGGLSFGVLDAFTREVDGVPGKVAEPRTNYAVVRAQQDLRGGETDIGFIATAVNRALDPSTDAFLHQAAYTGGLRFRHRFDKKQYEITAQLTGSHVSGSAQDIARTQRNSVHYYQQPGDDPAVDSTRTSLSGTETQLKFGKYGGGITRFETSVVRQSAGFDVNDIGFLRRADQLNWSTWAALSFREARGIYQWAQLNGNHWEAWNTSGTRLENAVNFNGHMGLRSNWDVHLGGTYAGLSPTYCDRCARGGPVVRSSAGFFPWSGVNTDSRKRLSAGMFINGQLRDEGNSRGVSLSPYVSLRVSTRFQATVGADISSDHDDAQWLGNFSDGANVTHYAFAHLDQRTTAISTRLNYTFTPNMTFEFYGQPFVANVNYSDIRELSANPRAAAFADRYQPYSAPQGTLTAYRVIQLRSSAVARWEYRPGSTLFLVWSHGRSDLSDDRINQSWTHDYRDLFSLHPDNTFVIKAAYLFSR
jgi:hypothetical protein